MDAPYSLKPPSSTCSQIRCPGLPKGFPCGLAGKESTCNAGDLDLISGFGRSPGEGKGYPLQYSGLENSLNCSPWGRIKCGYRFELWPKECGRSDVHSFQEEPTVLPPSVTLFLYLPGGDESPIGN